MQAAFGDDLEGQIRSAVRTELEPLMADLHRFLDRRIAELSAELDASVHLADMAEGRITRELATVHERIAHLVAVPAASTRNSGVELEAVVQATEAAANTILEAAESLQTWIAAGDHTPESINAMIEKVNSIFEACSFQDVTGQRIRRAIQHLQQVEVMLENLMPDGSVSDTGPKVQVKTQFATVKEPEKAGADLAQSDIDALLDF